MNTVQTPSHVQTPTQVQTPSQVQTPPQDHQRFDAICDQVGEWEALPALVTGPAEPDQERSHDEHVAAIDGLILAGLVSP